MRLQAPRSPGSVDAVRRRRRREGGLATLEWLIVVSVAALMAALVLAHVQRNVDRGVMQIAESSDGGSPDSVRSLVRAQALADELAYRVQVQSLEYDRYDYRFQDPVFWSEHFNTRCGRIREVFADLEAEGVTVAVESDFRMDQGTLDLQRIEPVALGEVPWIYGDLYDPPPGQRRTDRREQVPAFTVCQVFLSHEQTYNLTP